MSEVFDANLSSKLVLKIILAYIRYHKRTFIFSFISGTGLIYTLIQLKKFQDASRRLASEKTSATSFSRAERGRVGVNLLFVKQLKKLFPILIPSPFCREVRLLLMLTIVLVARTFLDIWFSAFNGVVIKTVVTRDKRSFLNNAIYLFGFMMWPLSIVNNSLKLIINSLSVSFRTRLTKYAHDKYLTDLVYYKVSNLDNRIQNADQLLTQDFEKFGENLSHLYSDIAKPIVDIILFAVKLGQAIGLEAPIYMLSYFGLSAAILRLISPPFGKFIAQEQKLEGEFRYTHSRILTYAEEIAFYGGHGKEKENANFSYQKILNHLRKVFKYKFINGIFDSIFVKYFATMLAYYILSRPVFDVRYSKNLPKNNSLEYSTKIMEEYTRNSGYLVNLSQAIGRLVLAGRDLTRFAGYTSRVYEFFNVLEDVKVGKYEKTMISKDYAKNKIHVLQEILLEGKAIEQDGIIDFFEVPIATPNGDILVPSLTFQIKKGMNCIITGPNGCGKSSLFRILGNLWPLYGGVLTKPRSNKLFYVPQKPYLPIGTLRDQVIYPNTKAQALEKGYDDRALYELLMIVHLGYLIEREGGWEALHDWSDLLSGGEKQRIAMARLFYHQPQFAILDECTSAVSVDVEGIMYQHAKKMGITLITVSHRPSLFQFHEYLLKFDGQGGYEFKPLKVEEDPFDDMRNFSQVISTEL